MEQTLVVKGNIYSVIRDENEIPTRVSRLKNNLTDLGRFLFGAWMAKHANYYINGGDVTGYISGIIIGQDQAAASVLVVIPQVSAIALVSTLASSDYPNIPGSFQAGKYSSSLGGYADYYYAGGLGVGLSVWQLNSSPAAWMGVQLAPASSDPTTPGVAYLDITRGAGSVTVTIKGYYSFSTNANSNYLVLTVDGRQMSGTAPLSTYSDKSVAVIFSRPFTASFTDGQSIRVTWQVNISGS